MLVGCYVLFVLGFKGFKVMVCLFFEFLIFLLGLDLSLWELNLVFVCLNLNFRGV